MRGQDTTWLEDTKVATIWHCSVTCQTSTGQPPTYTTGDYKEQKGLDSALKKITNRQVKLNVHRPNRATWLTMTCAGVDYSLQPNPGAACFSRESLIGTGSHPVVSVLSMAALTQS